MRQLRQNMRLSLVAIWAFGAFGQAVEADPPVVAANRLLWLRSDAGVNTSVTGAEVTSWQDVTNGLTFTGVAGASPKFAADMGDCTLPVVQFGNGANRLVGNLGMTLNASTVFALARYNAPTSSNDYIYTIGADGGAGSQMTLSRRDGTVSYHFNGSSSFLGEDIPGLQFHVFSQVYGPQPGGSLHTLHMDGVNLNVDAATASYSASGPMHIGNWSSGSFGFGGDLVEILVYDAALPDADRNAVEAYLAGRLASGVSSSPQLIAHWKADAGTNTTTHGQPVMQWISQTAGAQVLSNTAATNSPTYTSDAIGCSLPVVRFDGNDKLSGLLGTGLDDSTIFVVGRYAQATSGNSYLYAFGSDGSAGSQMTLSRYDGDLSYHYNGSSQFFGESIPGQAWHVFSQVYACSWVEGASWHRLLVDGVNRNVEITAIPYLTTDSMVLGNFTSGSYYFNGDVHEIRVYDRAMSDTERQAVEAELMAIISAAQPDQNSDGVVNVQDLLAVIAAWGPCVECLPSCAGDVDHNCVVNVNDLLALIGAWGACP